MFKKFTYAVTISALSALSLVTIASASGPYAEFTIANGDQNEEVEQTVNVEQPVRLNIQAGDNNDKPGAILDYTNFSIANGDENEEVGGSTRDSKISAAITVEQPSKLDIRGGDDSDMAVNVEQPVKLNIGGGDDSDFAVTTEQPVKLNIGGGDDSDMPRVRLNIGASDPAEQA